MPWREVFEHPPDHTHILQFYGEPKHQVDAASIFVAGGLRQREKVILSDTNERLEQIRQELERNGVKLDEYAGSRQLVIMDSDDAIEGLAKFDILNKAAIDEILYETKEQVDSGKYPRVRFCMRIAPQVAETGKSDLAASMEDQWQTSTRKHPSVALCAYSMKNLHPSMDSIDYWKQLMKSHTHVLSDVGLILPLNSGEFSIPYMEYQTASKPVMKEKPAATTTVQQ